MTGRRQEKSAETEAALKDAARRLFAERGYLNTKITDITAAAGRAAGSFYNHFAGKEELLQALLGDLAADGDLAAADAAHNPDFTDPAAVRYHIEQFWNYSRKHWTVLHAVNQAGLVNEDFARTARDFATQQREAIADHVDGFDAAGLRLPGRPDVSLAIGYLAASALLQAVEAGALDLTDAEAVDTLTRFTYRGLTGRDIESAP